MITVFKKLFVIFSVVCLFTVKLSAQTAITPSGLGTDTDPYLIQSLGNLYWISANPSSWSSEFLQTADIDASETSSWFTGLGWLPIGDNSDNTPATRFSGIYDGGSYTISNLSINRHDADYVGLFGAVCCGGTTAQIKNLSLINVSIIGEDNTGGLAGEVFNNVSIERVAVTGTVTGANNVGGVLGRIGGIGTNVSETYAVVTINGNNNTAGLIGESSTLIENSYSIATVNGGAGTSGGLVGTSSGTINKSYSASSVNSSGFRGGLIGQNAGFVNDSFWDASLTPAGAGGTGKTTSEMKDVATFTSTATAGLNNPWDFVGNPNDDEDNDDIWNIDASVNDGYPFLTWSTPMTPTVYFSSQNGNWNTAASWSTVSCGGTAASQPPGTDDDVVICDGNTIDVGTLVIHESDITIEANGVLRITEDGVLVAEGSISPSGEILILSGGLFNNQTSAVNITAHRQIGITPGQSEGWRYLTSPVDTNLSNLLGNIWTQCPQNCSTSFGEPNIYRWSTTSTDNTPQVGANGWVAVNNLDTPINAGDGFLVYVYEENFDGSNPLPQTLEVSGTEFFGNITVPVNSSAGGWTLLANPYPTAIDASQLFNGSIESALYVWSPANEGSLETPDPSGDPFDGIGFDIGSWKTYNGSNGDLTDGVIAPFQAFFVQTASGGNVNFSNTIKTSNIDSGNYLFKDQHNSRVRFEMAGVGLYNSAWIQFSEMGSRDVHVQGDTWKLRPMNGEFGLLATQKSDGSIFDIGHFPILPDETYSIPVYVETTRYGKFHIRLTDIQIAPDMKLYFVDTKDDISLPVTDGFVYSFDLKPGHTRKPVSTHLLVSIEEPLLKKAQSSENRFYLVVEHLSDPSQTELPVSVKLNQNFPNPFNPSTQIYFELPQQKDVTLSVYDLTGRHVATLTQGVMLAGAHTVTFNAENLSSGVYIYRLTAGSEVLTRKLTLLK